MAQRDITPTTPHPIRIVRHAEVRERLDVSESKLFDMVAKGIFPAPFQIVPGGRAVGWLESDVDSWILARRTATGVKS
jgi:prophage regulatory protein